MASQCNKSAIGPNKHHSNYEQLKDFSLRKKATKGDFDLYSLPADDQRRKRRDARSI